MKGNDTSQQQCVTLQNKSEAKAIPEKTGEQIAWFIYELMLRYSIFGIALNDQAV